MEGDELGHGVLTAALIEALHKGDANGNGRIEISELAAYVAKRVPELAEHIGELAAKKGVRNRKWGPSRGPRRHRDEQSQEGQAVGTLRFDG